MTQSVVVATTALVLSSTTIAPPAVVDGPGTGDPWVVTLGDSYISGEAGRWAGSSNRDYRRADALGPSAYFDNPAGNAETIPKCHRASSAEAHIGNGVNSLNLACSGAKTSTSTGASFKPGIDFHNSAAGKGQALMLQEAAETRNVQMVVVSIGGNDFDFAGIVQQCVVNFLTSPSWLKNYCHDDSSVQKNFTDANIANIRSDVSASLHNIATAMRNAGYEDSQWTLVVQTYPSPLPHGSDIRYRESGYSRQFVGGCGIWNADARWANSTALPTINDTLRTAASDVGLSNIRILDMSHAFVGKRLCEKGVGTYEEVDLDNWQSVGAVDKTEWINQIRTVSTLVSPYEAQESLHPNYWGQMAQRNCLRQVWNNGEVHSGTCVPDQAGTLTNAGEPTMVLKPLE